MLILIVCSACQHATKNPGDADNHDSAAANNNSNQLAIISINDVYRISGIDNGETGGLARVRELRKQIEANYEHVLFLHAGDFLHPSFISKQDNGAAMIKTLNMLDGALNVFDKNMLVTWGNHEFDKSKMKYVPMMNDLLAQSEFTWLDSNIRWKENSIKADNMIDHKLLNFGDFTVGVFSQSTDIAHPEYIESFVDFKTTAEKYVPWLRQQGADLVIALTHHWLPDDLAMMNLPADIRPDVIFGGHEHYVQTEQVNGNWILKADADGASAIVAEVTFSDSVHIFPQVIQLNKNFPEDQETLELTQYLSQTNDSQYCQKLNLADDCLTTALGITNTQLIAEETEIRRFETNLGNVLADQVLAEFKSCGADVVLLNSGSIRLNQNIPANSAITVKHLEEMFPYPSDLRLIEFDSSLLADILAHSISSWTANGHWLQIAGFVFIHNPELQKVEHIHLKDHEEPNFDDTAIQAENVKIRAVVPYYLISDQTDHDGFEMINERMQQPCDANGAQVKAIFTNYLKSLPNGLTANRDFRICNTSRDTCQ